MPKRVVINYVVSFWVILCSMPVAAQFTDNFDDGDYTQNPSWTDDSSAFIINTNGLLQLNAPATDGRSYIYIPSSNAIEASWEFKVKMDFNPSSTSYCRVFLMADQPNPANIANTYFLRIGGTNDDICLYHKQENTETLIINGRDKMLNTSTVNSNIKVTRDINGNWELLCDTTGNTDYKSLGTCLDNGLQQSEFFVIECVYIASRSTKFYFDDFRITGQSYSDGTIPALVNFKALSKNKLECTFSELIPDFSQGKFIVNDTILPRTIETMGEKVILTYPYPFNCQSNHLSITGICDKWKNCIKDTAVSFSYCSPQLFDIVFNEIMADPSPSVGLPDAEYIELYNRTDKAFRTENWHLTVGSTSYAMPDTQIMPGSYLLICAKSSESDLKKYGLTLALFTSATTLTNSGQTLRLTNNEDQLVAWVEYSDIWYNDDYKAQGGWAIEQIDPWNPCAGKDNWTASKSKTGGTPGEKNSVYNENKDLNEPEIAGLYVPNDTTIVISYNEPILSSTILRKESFQLSSGLTAKGLELTGNSYNSIQLALNQPMENSKTYSLKILPSVNDCAGNLQYAEIDTIIGVPCICDSQDIVINEVLFNSLANNPEYIEIYNRSDKILDASNLVFTFESINAKYTFGASQDTFLFYPHSYLVFSPLPTSIPSTYKHCNIKSMHCSKDWKALDDKAGTIYLQTRNLQVIDNFIYSESMHQPSLSNKEGVALERINQEVAANYPGNWHSAAETFDYGTPGLQNSQYIEEIQTNEAFSIENEIFSPDNDGYHDVLQVDYHFEKPGYRLSAWIFDAIGRKVTCILNNALPENSGFFIWDGNSDKGKLCTPGMYMVFIQQVNDLGEIKEFKKACILALKR